MKIEEVLKFKPVILCPFCDWNVSYYSKKHITSWLKHIEETKCYEDDDK